MLRINAYVNDLAKFNGDEWGDKLVKPADITRRVLKIAIPKNSISDVQRAAINAAKGRGVDLIIVPF